MKRIELLIIIIEIIIITMLSMLIGIFYDKNESELKDNNIVENSINIENQITYEQYNEVPYKEVKDAQMAGIYFNDYKEKLIYDYKEAYELIDSEYKSKKYKTIQEFEEYLKNEKIYLFNMYLDDYNIIKEADYTIYALQDQYENTYILKETAMMEYTVQLDNYTIENEELNKKYKSLDGKDRGMYNIDKFFSMINKKDYKEAYNLLDNNFKQNYFKTQSDFENYIKSKVFSYNKVKYKEYGNKTDDIYTYKIILTDAEEVQEKEIEFNIVIKLLEGTDFVMSFTVI